jgi:hypothetical protein
VEPGAVCSGRLRSGCSVPERPGRPLSHRARSRAPMVAHARLRTGSAKPPEDELYQRVGQPEATSAHVVGVPRARDEDMRRGGGDHRGGRAPGSPVLPRGRSGRARTGPPRRGRRPRRDRGAIARRCRAPALRPGLPQCARDAHHAGSADGIGAESPTRGLRKTSGGCDRPPIQAGWRVPESGLGLAVRAPVRHDWGGGI